MRVKIKKQITNYARKLRKNSTDVEKRLWNYLRNSNIEGFKFRRQQPIGKYIVDFVNFERKIIIEVDGSQHVKQKDKDLERDEWLKSQGFHVLRFWDNEVLKNTEGVLETIRNRILLPPYPTLSHKGER